MTPPCLMSSSYVLGSRDRHALTPDGLEQVVEPSQRGFAHALPGSEPSPDVSPSRLLEPRRPAVPREYHQAEIALDPLSLEVRLQAGLTESSRSCSLFVARVDSRVSSLSYDMSAESRKYSALFSPTGFTSFGRLDDTSL